jgi:hypothetical protein
MQLEILEEEELLEGLLQITAGNLGLSHQLLYKVIDRTREEVKGVLSDINQNMDRAKRHARRRAQRQSRKNLKLSGRYEQWYKNVSIHHIVAWGDRRAQDALAILIRYGIMPNDEANLVLLPRYREHTPHPQIKNAKSHSETHTDEYYDGVVEALVRVDVPGATNEDIEKALREIAADLEEGFFQV